MSEPGSVEWLAGLVAPRYELVRELGRGGMATVYLAYEPKHARQVAIKVLHTVGVPSSPERFSQEIRVTAGFSHPHILPLLDSGFAEGVPYYVMPYVPGESLRERLSREGPLPLDDVLRLTREIAEALDVAHRHNVIHRDIKPANILLEEGHARVADFGLVKAMDSGTDEGMTGTGVAMGTPTYMSPEQASPSAKVDGRSDVYALGCVVFEMLTGEPPFTASSARAVISKKVTQPVPSVTFYRDTVPAAVDRVLKKALAPAPADRFRTAGDLATALDGCASSPPASDNAFPMPGRVIAAGGVLTLLLAMAGVLAYRVLVPRGPSLDEHKVVVFPLEDGQGGRQDGLLVAQLIQGVLEHAGTLKLVDGWSRMDPAARADISMLAPEAERDIAKEQGARYYVGGRLIPRGDSLHVFLQVMDADGDTLVAQATGVGRVDLPIQVGFETLTRLLPMWLDPGREVDLSPVQDRDPGAVVSWIHGERAYRLGRFAEARDEFLRAVEADSLFAFAALKGAQAANWLENANEATSFLELALSQAELLPPKHRLLARGMDAYWRGDADPGVAALREALEHDPEWPEAWMALGEAYLHLIPSDATDASTSRQAFEKAWSLDPEFNPPLIHLAEFELLEGDVELGSRLVSILSSARPSEEVTAYLPLIRDCIQGRIGRGEWEAAAMIDPGMVLSAAKRLSERGARLDCAEGGFRALWEVEGVPGAYRWAGVMGLEAVYLAGSRFEAARAVLDSAGAWVGSGIRPYVIMAAMAGAPFADEADRVDEELSAKVGRELRTATLHERWSLTAWRGSRGDTAGVRAAVAAARVAADSGGGPEAALAFWAAQAHQAAAAGSTDQALEILASLSPVTRYVYFTWDPLGPLPLERMLRARLLLDAGRPAEALKVASVFDHPAAMVFLEFLPASLALRREAALAMDSLALAEELSERLDRLQGPSQPTQSNPGGSP